MKFIVLFCLLASLCCLFPALLRGADPAIDPAVMQAILGSDQAGWTITSSAHALTPDEGVTTPGLKPGL